MIHLIKQKIISLIFGKYTNLALLAIIFASLASYIYLANSTVHILTVLENSKHEKQALAVEVSELESKRLTADQKISSALATRLGLVEVKDQTFIVNKSKNLSFKTN